MTSATTTPSTLPHKSLDEAIRWMRTQPKYASIVRDAYLGADLEDSARRFSSSGEFAAVRQLLGDRINGACVLELGAGTGIASRAFLAAGASRIIAIEPDPSDLVGRGAMQRLCAGHPVQIINAGAEQLPLSDSSVDLIYARQVLHHLNDLEAALRECHRVLRPNGTFLACREHVVDDHDQLRRFLAAHPIHQLAGGEHAFSSHTYRNAVAGAGLKLLHELGPWDSVINAYPFVASNAELDGYARHVLEGKLGQVGRAAAHLPGIEAIVWRWLRRKRPGRMHTYYAEKGP